MTLLNQFTNLLLSLLHLRKRYTVKGSSMYPVLKEGSVVYTKKPKHLQIGDIVVAKHPYRDMLTIKRIRALHDDTIELVGENIESEDSRVFGSVKKEDVVGVVMNTSSRAKRSEVERSPSILQ